MITTQPEPPAPPLEQDYAKPTCDICGATFDTQHGVAMHKARAHPKKKRVRKARSKNTPTFNRQMAIKLVVGNSIPVRLLPRIEAWLEEGAAIRKEVG